MFVWLIAVILVMIVGIIVWLETVGKKISNDNLTAAASKANPTPTPKPGVVTTVTVPSLECPNTILSYSSCGIVGAVCTRTFTRPNSKLEWEYTCMGGWTYNGPSRPKDISPRWEWVKTHEIITWYGQLCGGRTMTSRDEARTTYKIDWYNGEIRMDINEENNVVLTEEKEKVLLCPTPVPKPPSTAMSASVSNISSAVPASSPVAPITIKKTLGCAAYTKLATNHFLKDISEWLPRDYRDRLPPDKEDRLQYVKKTHTADKTISDKVVDSLICPDPSRIISQGKCSVTGNSPEAIKLSGFSCPKKSN